MRIVYSACHEQSVIKRMQNNFSFVLNYITTHHTCQFVVLKSFKQCKFYYTFVRNREAKMKLFGEAKK